LQLADGQYIEHGSFERGTTASSVMLEGFVLEVEALFAAE
jgi:hypothetical protein